METPSSVKTTSNSSYHQLKLKFFFQVIILYFHTFELENNTINGTCVADYLEIMDNTTSQLLLCGNQSESSWKSASNNVFLSLHTDEKIQDRGFNITIVLFGKSGYGFVLFASFLIMNPKLVIDYYYWSFGNNNHWFLSCIAIVIVIK